jgi:hypothetical protein
MAKASLRRGEEHGQHGTAILEQEVSVFVAEIEVAGRQRERAIAVLYRRSGIDFNFLITEYQIYFPFLVFGILKIFI